MVADLSHWINVAETDTNDPDLTAVIEAFASRFRHIHLRVGYDHGPQVIFFIIKLVFIDQGYLSFHDISKFQ